MQQKNRAFAKYAIQQLIEPATAHIEIGKTDAPCTAYPPGIAKHYETQHRDTKKARLLL